VKEFFSMFKPSLASKFLRYGFSSGLALLVDVGFLWGLSRYSSVDYLWAAGIGFSAGCAVNYVASKTIVFDDHSNRKPSITLVLFVLVGLIGLLINHIILFIGVDLLAMHLLAAKAVSAMLVFWFNFLARGYFVFKDPDLYNNNQPKKT
jgi:putative flippase GtrA